MTLKTPSSVYVGARPRTSTTRANSSAVSLCCLASPASTTGSPKNGGGTVRAMFLLDSLAAKRAEIHTPRVNLGPPKNGSREKRRLRRRPSRPRSLPPARRDRGGGHGDRPFREAGGVRRV